MRRGFIFDHNKCVGCNACSAACILENGWNIHARLIYTFNSDAVAGFPLTNLSLACNHCEKPACLESCPSGSYSRDNLTGAIIIDDKKCIGCKYCQWNCPYDAPKFDIENRVIGKCNMCYSGLAEGRMPACVNGCPTGALSFGELSENQFKNRISWFPDRSLNPLIQFSAESTEVPLRTIPGTLTYQEIKKENEKSRSWEHWSLVIFSFITTLSVSQAISSLIKGTFPEVYLFISLIIIAGTASLFHLGKAGRAWRAVTNMRYSPLSREIAAFLAYSSIAIISVITEFPIMLIAASIAGLVLLALIDFVYIHSDRRNKLIFHSGQTLLSALLIISFITGNLIPFIFIAVIKLASSVYNLSSSGTAGNNFGIRYLRLAILLITGIRILSGGAFSESGLVILFLAGELIDRIIFYIDFEPVSIVTVMNRYFNAVKHEKKEVNSSRMPVYRDAGFELYDANTTAGAFRKETEHEREPENYIYSRYRNPTVVSAEEQIMRLEGSDWALLTQSGMSAIDTAISIFQKGKETSPWLFFTEIYGGTISYVESVLKRRRGLDIHYFTPVDGKYDLKEFEKLISALKPEFVYIESISNPMLIVADVKEITSIAKKYGVKVIIDNTFATPWLYKPLADGADIVIHSATKYFSGHGNLTAGVICGNDRKIMKDAIEYRKFVGHMLSPDDAYRLETHILSFGLRFSRQCSNAFNLAGYLSKEPVINKVWFPGLSSHPSFAIARQLFGGKGFGAMITFDFEGKNEIEKRARRDRFIILVSEKIKLIPTLGDAHTILMPVEAVWGAKYPEPGMIRLSVGFEEYSELEDTIKKAIEAL